MRFTHYRDTFNATQAMLHATIPTVTAVLFRHLVVGYTKTWHMMAVMAIYTLISRNCLLDPTKHRRLSVTWNSSCNQVSVVFCSFCDGARRAVVWCNIVKPPADKLVLFFDSLNLCIKRIAALHKSVSTIVEIDANWFLIRISRLINRV